MLCLKLYLAHPIFCFTGEKSLTSLLFTRSHQTQPKKNWHIGHSWRHVKDKTCSYKDN
jgi:hypothetical protein